jgi:predicted nucleotidyltransferase component of viral defense system
MNPMYVQTVNLLLDVVPSVFKAPFFAMKGGTAINLFVQDMPRLSVDIDVVYCDHTVDREEALQQISHELNRISAEVLAMGFEADFRKTKGEDEVKIIVSSPETQVKIEVNFVFRGTVLPVQMLSLSKSSQELFSKNIDIPSLAVSELYGSKLVAALDRQHPRDLFDVMKMYETHGLTSEITDCFVIYLAGHNRPVHEVLFANRQPIAEIFRNEFAGMTYEEVSVEELEAVRSTLMEELPKALTKGHKDFLLSLVQGTPDWGRLPYDHLSDLPALKWKLQNLEKLKTKDLNRFNFQYAELVRLFG